MSEPRLIASKSELPIDDISLHDRLRPVGQAGAATIVASVREIGQLTNPVVVRQLHRNGEQLYRVLDGAHRLEAARQLGWSMVPVRVFECTDDHARMMEIDGNLSGAELNALDTAVFLATRKEVYERMHPDKRRGLAGGLARQGLATELGSFADATADKFNLTPRQVYKIVSAGSRLQPDEIARLRAAPKAVTLKDLQVIAKAQTTDRYFIVDLLAKGAARSAADAIRQSKDAPPVLSDADRKYSRLLDAWGRASVEVRRRFVAERWSEMAGLMRDAPIEGAVDETEIVETSAPTETTPIEDLVRWGREIVRTDMKASTSYLQRKLGVTYSAAVEIMDRLEAEGIVSTADPAGRRAVLVKGGDE